MTGQFHDTLLKYWGYSEFRTIQLPAIESIYGRRDTLVLMPTGGGKSLVYQLPAMLMDGVCIVVTPLVALMKDQVDRLIKRDIRAVAIHSGLTKRQIDIALDNCVYGDVKFLYVAPERLTTELFQMRVSRMQVSMIAVDEAHCISQWGYDFRPSYLQIASLRKIAPAAPMLALTASATGEVAQDIMQKLQFKDGIMLRSSFARENLSYTVRKVEDKPSQLIRIVNNVPGVGIVYVRTREGTQQVAQMLMDSGVPADFYHAGLNHFERARKQDDWTSGRTRVIVATTAFGMGIDKADVRFVVHYDTPSSPEEYYQEAGRAGRDGRRAYAVLLSGTDEQLSAGKRFAIEFPPIETIRECYESVFNYLQIGIGEGKFASFTFNLHEFATRHKVFEATAINAIKVLQQNGYMTLTEAIDNPSRLMFIVGRDDLYKIRIERGELDHILRIILRLYSGFFHNFVSIDEAEIATVSGYTKERVHELLKKLWQLRVIRYIPAALSPLLILTEERLPAADLRISPESYRMRKEIAAERLESVFQYCDNEDKCRSVILQEYFGDEDSAPCGICDICLNNKKNAIGGSNLEEEILAIVKRESISVKELVAQFRLDEAAVIRALDNLIGEVKISIDSGGKLRINR